MTRLRQIRNDQSGATIVEFALIAPTLMLLLTGLFELGHTMYVQSIVNGAMQEAGRNSTIENARINQIAAETRKKIRGVAPNATITFRRRNHQHYASIGKMEQFTDLNGDGRCNDGEPFEDLNDNGRRDRANGLGGQGNARDAVVFTVTVTYKRMLPMPSLAGWSPTNTVQGTTILRNQPFRQQEKRVKIRNCR
ncbi:MAG: TadE/TadG family type IV pilus assembly protein [Sphingomonadaceae bacterium]